MAEIAPPTERTSVPAASLESTDDDLGKGLVLDIAPPAVLGGRPPKLEDLMEFRRWSVFLPTAASSEAERNAVYVRARHTGNPQFFDQVRDRLRVLLHDRDLLSAVDARENDGGAIMAQALEVVLHSQLIALGFASDRQFHKALALGELGVAVVDALAAAAGAGSLATPEPGADAEAEPGGGSPLLFWQLLCRVNLGGAHARFGKRGPATTVLRQGLTLAEGVGSEASLAPGERVLLGALYAQLSRVCLEAGDLEEAPRLAEMEIELFERFIWDLSDAREDREVQALVLATSYVTRGICDVRQRRYETALMWFGRAQESVEKNRDLGPDASQLLEIIRGHIEHAQTLHM